MQRKILVIMVTRLRPLKALHCYEAWRNNSEQLPNNAGGVHSDFMLAYDDDDESYDPRNFPAAMISRMTAARVIPALNMRAMQYCDAYSSIMHFGDDQWIRTKDWDKMMLDKMDAIGGQGVLYPDDLLQREHLATAACISSEIIKALGYFGLPCVKHMYAEGAWMMVGRAIGKLVYMPNIIIEHMHYQNGKAVMDAQYQRANAMYTEDCHAATTWRQCGQAEQDLARVKNHLASIGWKG